MAGTNLRKLRKANGMTQTELGERLSLSKTAISLYESDKRSMDTEHIKALADLFGCTTDYLLEHRPSWYDSCIPVDGKNIFHLPIIGEIAAGDPEKFIQKKDGTFPLDTRAIFINEQNVNEYFWLEVKGTSMEPVIHENSMVLVHKQNKVEQGEIAVVLCDEMENATLKKYYHDGEHVTLLGFNPEYTPIVRHFSQCRVIGRAVWYGGYL